MPINGIDKEETSNAGDALVSINFEGKGEKKTVKFRMESERGGTDYSFPEQDTIQIDLNAVLEKARKESESIVDAAKADAEKEDNQERQEKLAEEKKRKNRTLAIRGTIVGIIVLVIIVVAGIFISKESQYNEALGYLNTKKYAEAEAAFQELGDYRDAESLSVKSHNLRGKELATEAKELFATGKSEDLYDAWMIIAVNPGYDELDAVAEAQGGTPTIFSMAMFCKLSSDRADDLFRNGAFGFVLVSNGKNGTDYIVKQADSASISQSVFGTNCSEVTLTRKSSSGAFKYACYDLSCPASGTEACATMDDQLDMVRKLAGFEGAFSSGTISKSAEEADDASEKASENSSMVYHYQIGGVESDEYRCPWWMIVLEEKPSSTGDATYKRLWLFYSGVRSSADDTEVIETVTEYIDDMSNGYTDDSSVWNKVFGKLT